MRRVNCSTDSEHETDKLDFLGPNTAQILSRIAAVDYRPAYLSRGKSWFINYYVKHPNTGKLKRRTEKLNRIKSIRERERFAYRRLKELNFALALGWNPFLLPDPVSSRISVRLALSRFIEAKLAQGLRKDSMRSYRSLASMFLEWCISKNIADGPLTDLTSENVQDFMVHRQTADGIGPRTYNNNLTFYTTLGLWFVKKGYRNTNMFGGLRRITHDKRKKNRRKLTNDERIQVRTYLLRNDRPFLIFSMIIFHCGLRMKEAFHLQPRHVDLGRQFILVEGRFAKNHHDRRAAIPDVLLSLLKSLKIEDVPEDNYLFSTGFVPGKKLKDSRYSGKRWSKLRSELGLDLSIKHYSLRDTGARQLVRDGVDVNELCGHLDHHSLAQTAQYSVDKFEVGSELVKRKATEF